MGDEITTRLEKGAVSQGESSNLGWVRTMKVKSAIFKIYYEQSHVQLRPGIRQRGGGFECR